MRRVLVLGLFVALVALGSPAQSARLEATYKATGAVRVSAAGDFEVSGKLSGPVGLASKRSGVSPIWAVDPARRGSFSLRWFHGTWLGGPTVGASGHALARGVNGGTISWAGGFVSKISLSAVAYTPRAAIALGRVASGLYSGSSLLITMTWPRPPTNTSSFTGRFTFA